MPKLLEVIIDLVSGVKVATDRSSDPPTKRTTFSETEVFDS